MEGLPSALHCPSSPLPPAPLPPCNAQVVNGRTIEITFTDTEVKLAGGLRGWLDSVPRFTVPSLVPDWLQASAGWCRQTSPICP